MKVNDLTKGQLRDVQGGDNGVRTIKIGNIEIPIGSGPTFPDNHSKENF